MGADARLSALLPGVLVHPEQTILVSARQHDFYVAPFTLSSMHPRYARDRPETSHRHHISPIYRSCIIRNSSRLEIQVEGVSVIRIYGGAVSHPGVLIWPGQIVKIPC